MLVGTAFAIRGLALTFDFHETDAARAGEGHSFHNAICDCDQYWLPTQNISSPFAPMMDSACTTYNRINAILERGHWTQVILLELQLCVRRTWGCEFVSGLIGAVWWLILRVWMHLSGARLAIILRASFSSPIFPERLSSFFLFLAESTSPWRIGIWGTSVRMNRVLTALVRFRFLCIIFII